MKKSLFILPAFFLLFFCLSYSGKTFERVPVSSAAADSSYIDSVYALNLLKLTDPDSAFLHLDSTDKYLVDEINRINIKDKPGSTSQIYIRSVLSAVYSDYSYTGSFLVLYVSTEEPEKAKRISEDSIEIIYSGGLEDINPQVNFGDLNFDGYKDFYISFVQNELGSTSINFFYLFDPSRNEFVKDKRFQFEAMSFDENKREISTAGRVGFNTYWSEDYRWNGRNYELYAKESTEYNEEGRLITVREELVEGEWQIIFADTLK